MSLLTRIRFAVLSIGVASVAGATGHAAAPALARDAVQATICGVGNGSSWASNGRAGADWLVVALDDKNQCKGARQFLPVLSARIVAGGADVQAFHTLGDACVLTRSQLFAACRTGNGGGGSVGIAVFGDPQHNLAERPYVGARTSFPALPSAGSSTSSSGDTVGIPIPTSGGTTCPLAESVEGPNWAFLLHDGALLRGNRWFVKASRFVNASSCASLHDLWTSIADAAGAARANTNSWNATSWISGGWACTAAHDMAWPGGGSSIADMPIAGCARVTYPGSAGVLEQVVVYPDPESGTNGAATVAQTRLLNARIIAIRNAVDSYGIGVVALSAVTAVRLDGPPPGGHPSTGTHPLSAEHVSACGATSHDPNPALDVYGSRWTHGSEHGSGWELSVNAGYPCELAHLLFLPFLADILSGPNAGSLPAGRLQRNGWTCMPNPSTLIAVCSFTATGGGLADAIGKPLPAGLRIGIRAAYSAGATRETLSRAIQATL
jgi:hypothetical protein